MNGYLVVGRCATDDVPLRLFGGEKEARDYALAEVTREAILAACWEQKRVVPALVSSVRLVKITDGVPGRHQRVRGIDVGDEGGGE